MLEPCAGLFAGRLLPKLRLGDLGEIVVSRTTADIAKMSFETALAELREIVEALEKGEGRLEDAINSYERGAALKQHCEAKLSEAQQKIEKISHDSKGTIGTEDLDIE